MPFLLDSLSDFLESKWGIRDRFVIDTSIALDARIFKAIQGSPENKESLCHLQIEGTIVSVWRPQDWALAYDKFKEDKRKSEERLAATEKEKECITYIESLVIAKFGEAGKTMAGSLARDIVKGKKTTSALMFGAEKEKLNW